MVDFVILVWSTSYFISMRGRSLWPVLQPATRGRSSSLKIWSRLYRISTMFMLLIADCKLTIPFQNMTSYSPVIDYEQCCFTANSPFRYKLFLIYSFRPYRGSVLTWSSISYSVSGRVLLEDAYEWRANQQISRRGRGRRPKGEKMKRFFRFFSMWESGEGKRRL